MGWLDAGCSVLGGPETEALSVAGGTVAVGGTWVCAAGTMRRGFSTEDLPHGSSVTMRAAKTATRTASKAPPTSKGMRRQFVRGGVAPGQLDDAV
jgi:hypothetical protein